MDLSAACYPKPKPVKMNLKMLFNARVKHKSAAYAS